MRQLIDPLLGYRSRRSPVDLVQQLDDLVVADIEAHAACRLLQCKIKKLLASGQQQRYN